MTERAKRLTALSLELQHNRVNRYAVTIPNGLVDMMLTERHRKVLEAVAAQSAAKPGSHVINTEDAEECENLGLIEKDGPGRYHLTARGRSALKLKE
jgi:hypothetical protein